jgi:hypothetical protein
VFACDNRENLPVERIELRTIDQELKGKLSTQQKYRGVVLTYGETGGIGFTDSIGLSKLFRSINFTVGNDTTVPISLQLNFSDKPYSFFHTEYAKYNAFLMPDSVKGYRTTLKTFLSKRLREPSITRKVIYPGETYTAKIGMLFYTVLGMPDGSASEEMFFKGFNHNPNRPDTIINLKSNDTSGLDIILGTALHERSTYYSNIVCGQIFFHKLDSVWTSKHYR